MKNKLPKDIKEFILEAKQSQKKPVYEMTPDEFRLMIQKATPEYNRSDYNVFSKDEHIYGRKGLIPVRIYTPKTSVKKKRSGVIYLLGGGFIAGTLEHQDLHCRLISERTDSVVIAVCYRLAPEHKYPAGLYDVEDAIEWIFTHSDLGVEGKNCSLVGYSSGGTFAAAMANKGKINFAKLILIAPCLDFARTCNSHKEFKEGVMLDEKDLDWHWHHYLPPRIDLKNPILSPLYQVITKAHPPTLIITFQFCPFRDEGHKYAEKLDNAGVSVVEKRYAGLHLLFSLSATQIFNEDNPIYGVCAFLKKKERKNYFDNLGKNGAPEK